MPATIPPWVIVKFQDQIAPSLGSFAAMSLDELVQHFEDLLLAGALDVVAALGIDLEFTRAWEPVSPEDLQELVDRANAAEPPDEDVNLEAFLRVVVPDFVDPRTLVDVLNQATGVVEFAYVGGEPDLPAVVGTTNPHFTALGYLQPAPLGVDALRAWQLGADGAGVSIIDIETGFFFAHQDLPSNIGFLGGDNSDGGAWHGTAVLGVMVAKDDAVGGVGLAPGAKCDAMSWKSASGATEPPELAARIVEAALALSEGDIIVVEAQLFSFLEGSDNVAVPAETDVQVFHAIRHATRIGIVVIEAAGNGGRNLDHFAGPPTGGNILDRASAQFRDSGAIMVGSATSAPPRTRLSSSNFGSRVDCYSWGEHILAPGEMPTTGFAPVVTPTSYWPLNPGFGHTSGATSIIGGVAALVQGLATSLPSGPGLLRSKAMRALFADPQLGVSTIDVATGPIGRQPNLRKIAERFA
jgi:hypothetical protein